MDPACVFVFLQILFDDIDIGVDDFLVLAVVFDQGAETLVALDLGSLVI